MPSLERTDAYAELKLDKPGSAASMAGGLWLKYRQSRQEGASIVHRPNRFQNSLKTCVERTKPNMTLTTTPMVNA
jgi:hypothetical protein